MAIKRNISVQLHIPVKAHDAAELAVFARMVTDTLRSLYPEAYGMKVGAHSIETFSDPTPATQIADSNADKVQR